MLNSYNLEGEYGVGYTSNTGAEFFFDKEDFDLIRNYTWNEHILTNGYHALEAWDSNTKTIVRMPWVIAGKNQDHINHNPLDNRKHNLREATQRENVYNRGRQKTNISGVTGVFWMKDRNKWRSQLRKNGESLHTKDHIDFHDAVKERLQAEATYFGEFAPQAHLFPFYGIRLNGGVVDDLS